MKRLFFLAMLLAASLSAHAQFGLISFGAPTGSCSANTLAIDNTNNVVYSCGAAGAWVYVGQGTALTLLNLKETTAPAGVAGFDICYADSSAHAIKCSWNNGSFVAIPQLGGDLGNTSASPQVLSTHLSAALPVAQGGTGLASGTSGGVLAYTAAGTLASSGALTANVLVKGGGAGVAPTTSSITDSGSLISSSEVALLGNKVFVSGDFIDSNSAALQAITGLTYSLGSTAVNVSFHCSLMYSQATPSAGDQFGVAILTVAPTNVSAFSTVNTNATTVSYGVLTNLASTTPTAIVTFTPAVTTVLGAQIDGTVETAGGGGAATLQFYVLNGTAANIIVVKRDSYCTLY